MKSTERLVLVISILSSLVAFLDGTVVSVAMPAIIRELGGGLSLQQWVNDAYLVTLGTLILAAGSLSDIFGRKRLLQYGLIGFLITSLLCAAAPNGVFLIVARAFQGAAGALIVPSSLALIISVFKGPSQSKAIGQWTAWTGITFILGPLVGGTIVSIGSWRFVFLINVIPIIIALVFLGRLQFDRAKQSTARVDRKGIILGAGGLGGIVFSLIEQETYGIFSPIIILPFLAGLFLLAAFALHERRTPEPMLPFDLFKNRNFRAGNIATFFIYAALSLQAFVVVIFLQQVAGFPPTLAGLAALPVSILMFLLSGRFGALAGRFGPRLFMSLGPIIGGLGILLMLSVQPHTDYWTQILPSVIVFGIGLSMTVAPLTSAILGSISSEQAGVGSALNNAVARIAALISVALVGVIAGGALDIHGFHRSIAFCAGLLIVGGLISAVGIKNPDQLASTPLNDFNVVGAIERK